MTRNQLYELYEFRRLSRRKSKAVSQEEKVVDVARHIGNNSAMGTIQEFELAVMLLDLLHPGAIDEPPCNAMDPS